MTLLLALAACSTGSPASSRGASPAPPAGPNTAAPLATTPPASASPSPGATRSAPADPGKPTIHSDQPADGPPLPTDAVALAPGTVIGDAGRCSVGAIRIAPVDLQGAPGSSYANFTITDTSRSTCALKGYVGAQLLGDNGQPMPTTVANEPGPDQWVQLKPGGSAKFHLRFGSAQNEDTPCLPPNSPQVRVTAPGTGTALTVASPEGGIQPCHGALSTAPLSST